MLQVEPRPKEKKEKDKKADRLWCCRAVLVLLLGWCWYSWQSGEKKQKGKKDRKAGINALGEDVPITFHVLMICEFQWYCRNATQDESKNMLCHLIAGTGV